MSFKIEYVNYGIANRFSGRYIEVHNKLRRKYYKPLLHEIIKHEKEHSDTGYSWRDLGLEIQGFKNKKLWRHFIITTPSSWVQFLPIYRSKRGWFIDPIMTAVWFLIGALVLSFIIF